MIDELAHLAVAAAADVAIKEAAKRHRWVRVLQVGVGLLFVSMIVGAIYLTVRYS